jgi:hypothetical protein
MADQRDLRYDDLRSPPTVYDRNGPGAGIKGLGPTENKAAKPEPETKKKPTRSRRKPAAKKEATS